MDTKKILLLIIGVVILAILLIGLTPQATGLFGANQQDNYKLGLVMPLTGHFSNYGLNGLNGAKMTLDGTTEIELFVENDEGTPEKAASSAKRLIEMENVSAIFSFRSSTSAAIAPIAEQTKTLHLYASSATESAKKYDWVFSNYGGTIKDDCKEIKKHLIENIVFVGLTLDSSMECISELEKNGKTFNKYLFNTEDKDFKSQITQIQAENLGQLIIRADEKSLPLILKQMKELNYKPKQIICPQATSSGCANKETLNEYAEYFTNAIATDNYTLDSKEIVEFNKKYFEKYGTQPLDSTYSVYENVKILTRILKECKGENECMKQKLLTETFQGIESQIKFDANGVAITKTKLFRFDGNKWVSAN